MKTQKIVIILTGILIILAVFTSCKEKKKYEEIEKTGWEVSNVENYEYNMTYVTKVAFDNTVSKNREVEIAAFYGKECRGFTKLIYDEHMDEYLCMLTIYSNTSSGENMTIKVYNPSKKRVYETNKKIGFKNNSSVGSPVDILNCND